MENESNHPAGQNYQVLDLHRYFVSHLNKIYCVKHHLALALPKVLDLANSDDLKEAINQAMQDLARQLSRISEILQIMKATYHPAPCHMVNGIIDDLKASFEAEDGNPELQDMNIIYYLQNIESLEMASFHSLQMAALKLKNEDINEILTSNFEDAKAERTFLRLLTAKYLTA